MDNDNNEKVNPKLYIKKGFWISLGAVGGIAIIAIGVIGIGELSSFVSNIPVAYRALTAKDDDYCKDRYCEKTALSRIMDAYSVFVLCRKDNICMWK
jgi:hypothetical protein